MQLFSVRIQNLRSCSDVEVRFGAYTCLVGANGAGKSNILCALNIFFRQAENTSGDFSQLVAGEFLK
jgi:putative ATP-dependent endonuclease of the OLD family